MSYFQLIQRTRKFHNAGYIINAEKLHNNIFGGDSINGSEDHFAWRMLRAHFRVMTFWYSLDKCGVDTFKTKTLPRLIYFWLIDDCSKGRHHPEVHIFYGNVDVSSVNKEIFASIDEETVKTDKGNVIFYQISYFL